MPLRVEGHFCFCLSFRARPRNLTLCEANSELYPARVPGFARTDTRIALCVLCEIRFLGQARDDKRFPRSRLRSN
ncbi:MAG: hypothetical protein JWO44_275 [Bacteroidetes bacterium]|nr:hypothetical protein [Bacteroidota bacterium]